MKIKFKKTYISILIVAILGVVAYFNLNKKPVIQYVTAKAEIGNLVQTVSESGTVKTAKQLDLNFLASGKIAKLNVKIGDKVKKDQVLAELDYSSLNIQARQSAASLQSANATLSKTINGATSQDVAISQASANQAQSAYQNSLNDLTNTKNSSAELISQAEKNLNDLQSGVDKNISAQQQAVISAQTNLTNTKTTFQQTLDNRQSSFLTILTDKISVVKTALDSINRILTDQDAKDTLGVQDISQLVNANSSYQFSLIAATQASASLTNAKNSNALTDINQAGQDTISLITKTLTTLNYTFTVLEKSVTSAKLTQAELDGFKSSVSGQSSIVNGANSAVQSGQQALNDSILALNTNVSSAQNNLNQAQTTYNNTITTSRNNLANAKLSADQQIATAKARVDSTFSAWQITNAQFKKIMAAPRSEDIKLAQAQVLQAQAVLDGINNQINNSIIKSPINGQVTKLNYEVGEQPTAVLSVVSILTDDNFEIDIDISESDITKIRLADQTSITFDALGEDAKFTGEVVFIEPAQTIIQDVVYYKTTIGNIHPFSATTSPTSELIDSTNASSSALVDLTPNQLNNSTSTATSSLSIASLIKPGMTANVIITTDQENNVLYVPDRAIIINPDNSKTIRILQNNTSVDKPVIIGLKADEGLTQITSGISAGDLVITSIKNPTP